MPPSPEESEKDTTSPRSSATSRTMKRRGSGICDFRCFDADRLPAAGCDHAHIPDAAPRWGHSSVGRALEWHQEVGGSNAGSAPTTGQHRRRGDPRSRDGRRVGRTELRDRSVSIEGGQGIGSSWGERAQAAHRARRGHQHQGCACSRVAFPSSRIRPGVSRRRLRQDDIGDAECGRHRPLPGRNRGNIREDGVARPG